MKIVVQGTVRVRTESYSAAALANWFIWANGNIVLEKNNRIVFPSDHFIKYIYLTEAEVNQLRHDLKYF